MPRTILLSVFLTAGAAMLSAQTMIEYGVNAGRSGAAAGAAGAGRSAVTIFNKVGRSLDGAANADSLPKPGASPAAAATAVTPAVAPAAAPAAPALPADLTALAVGMERAELLKKVGKPSMSMSGTESETFWYRTGASSVTVILRDGKVAEITGAEKVASK